MGVDLYLVNTKTDEKYNLGRAYNYLGYHIVPTNELNLDILEDIINSTQDTVKSTISEVLSDLLYEPKSYTDAENLRVNVKNKLDLLYDECERIGRLCVIRELLEEDEFRLEQG